jgi:hypothetical protein
MREIVEQDSKEGCDDENLDDVGAACHRYNSNLCNAISRLLMAGPAPLCVVLGVSALALIETAAVHFQDMLERRFWRRGHSPTDEAAMKLLYLVLHPSMVVIAGLQDVPESE